MKNEQKALALSLRLEKQLSLRQIHDITGLSKSTLSILLRNHQLSKERIAELSIGCQLIGAAVNKQKADARKEAYKATGKALLKNNKHFRDLCLLYWGEGSKYATNTSFSISNTDAEMIRFIVNVIKSIGFYDELNAISYCFPHSNLDDVKNYWKDFVGKEIKTYVVKNSIRSKNLRTDKQPYGTLRVEVYRGELLHMVLGGIEELKNLDR